MKLAELDKLFEEYNTLELEWKGHCHDCGKEVSVLAKITNPETGEFEVTGGAVYHPEGMDYFLKCDDCYQRDPILRNFRPCEVYSRVVGYLRPVSQWNKGKQEEWKNRTEFSMKRVA